MARSLSALIRLHRWEVDEGRRALGVLLARDETLAEEQRAMVGELAREQAMAARDPAGAGAGYGHYARRFIERQDALTRQRAALGEEIERARTALADGYRRLKSYEVAEAAREERARVEAERKDQAVLDEIGSNLHRRRGDG